MIPKPPFQPKPKRLPRAEQMTVCIAAACEHGSMVVAATDRLISYAGIAANTVLAKMYWLDDWLVMYAGQPSNTSLIIDDLHRVLGTTKLNRENIQQSFRAAYQHRKGLMSSFAALSSYNMTLEEFRNEGLRKFGPEEFKRISQDIDASGKYFNEQLLIVGWGKTEKAVMLYELGYDGDRDHRLSGIASIGTGSEVAISTLMALGQKRDSSLADTLYAVAAAKFASEKSSGGDVGRHTAMYVTWKRNSKDTEFPPGIQVQEWQTDRLYRAWERYGKPTIPRQAYPEIVSTLRELDLTDRDSSRMLAMLKRLASRKSKRVK